MAKRLDLDQEVKTELSSWLKSGRPLPPSFQRARRSVVARLVEGAPPVDPNLEGLEGVERVASDPTIEEAIVRLFDRPSLFIENDRIAEPESEVWRRRLSVVREVVEPSIASVGRVELVNHDDNIEWVGTAWMVTDTVAITNRHVAEVFGEKKGSGFDFRVGFFTGQKVGAKLDFAEEHITRPPVERKVARILYIAPPGGPDMALVELDNAAPLPRPLELRKKDPTVDDWVGVIGYPARDSRNDAGAQASIFGDVFNVKRFAPGQVMTRAAAEPDFAFSHDASTLGGNSGSVVLGLRDGAAVGLHFAGRFEQANFAVRASVIRAEMERANVRPISRTPEIGGNDGLESIDLEARRKNDPTHDASFFKGRQGWDAAHLGQDFPLSWPGMQAYKNDLATLETPARDGNKNRLDYTHFSVVMHGPRRTPLVTAVNIDGKQARSISRGGDVWYFDGRLAREFQIGNDDGYRNNTLDRGHMVRREDPNWGEEATQANFDTFHYTNAAPQHERLNQRTWLELEDFVLGTAKARDLKATVFTGPVLREEDMPYREIQVPSEFWKVVTVVDEETGKLEATGYVLSQVDLLGDLEAVFDGGNTYQVPIREIEAKTNLDFGALKASDPMESIEETPGGVRARRIRRPSDIVHRG